MAECAHIWRMTNRQFGFVVFEKCSHCQVVRAYYAEQDTWDDHREDRHHWSIVENAQTFRFDLECADCGMYISFDDFLGLLSCTSCMEDCPVEVLQNEYAAEKTWVFVGFGFLPESQSTPYSEEKLLILSEYFNQRRDTSRSTVKILPNSLITKLSLCRGDFIHDVGMLSLDPPGDRKPLF